MQKSHPYCCVRTSNFREFGHCEAYADYTARLLLSNHRELKLELCSRHLRNAAQIGRIQASRMFPGEGVQVISTILHRIALGELPKAS